MIELGIGVHSRTADVTGNMIRLFTEICCTPPWVLGPAHPATHVYTWASIGDVHLRVDAEPPRAVIERWIGPSGPWNATAHWRLSADHVDVEAGFNQMLRCAGMPYDKLELPAQPLIATLKALGKSRSSIPSVLTDGVDGALICTTMASRILTACGGPAQEWVRSLPDMFPETLAQHASKPDVGQWLVRVC